MKVYTASGGQSTVAEATETAIVITAPSNQLVQIRRIRVSQATHGTSEQYGLTLARASAAGSGGSAVTPAPCETNQGAAASTVAKNQTSEPTYTTTLLDLKWNSLIGKDIILEGGSELYVAPTGIIGIAITSPAAMTTFTPVVEVEFAEIG